MAGIEGESPVTPQMRETYKQECAQGVTLFQETLKAYQKSQIDEQKKEYKDVMAKALQVIRETAPQCLNRALQEEELKLEQDYKKFIADPSPSNIKTLSQDLQHLRDCC